MEIKKRYFVKNRYGKELLIDCTLFSQINKELPKNKFTSNYYGICLITSGKGSILIDNNIIDFEKCQLLFFHPAQVKQWKEVTPDFDGYFLVFEHEFIQTFFQDSFFIYRFHFFHSVSNSYMLECEQEFFTSLLKSCKIINTELSKLQEDSHHFLRSILYNILILINRKYANYYKLSVGLFQDNTGLQLKKLLENKIRNYHRVEEYSNFLNISRSYLNSISKKTFGFPISYVIKERLLTEIKRELLFTEKSAKEICFEMNFSDVSNFTRFFKSQTGLNPREYRSEFTK